MVLQSAKAMGKVFKRCVRLDDSTIDAHSKYEPTGIAGADEIAFFDLYSYLHRLMVSTASCGPAGSIGSHSVAMQGI